MSLNPLLIVVPARAGSEGVRGKNLQVVDGVPLVARAIHRAKVLDEWWRQNGGVSIVVVSTDSDAVASIARAMGDVTVHARPAELAEADVPLWEAIADVVETITGEPDEYSVVVMQPTAATLTASSALAAVLEWEDSGAPSGHTVTPLRHHGWSPPQKYPPHSSDVELVLPARPLYEHRNQRGDFDHHDLVTLETGGVQCVRRGGDIRRWSSLVSVSTDEHELLELDPDEAIDVDTHADLAAARSIASRRRILWVVEGTRPTGSGHIHRAVSLMHLLGHHQSTWAWAPGSPDEWAVELAESLGAPDDMGSWDALDIDDLSAFSCIVFDALEPDPAAVAMCKAAGRPVVMLEALGAASDMADLVVNELYHDGRPHAVTGPRYAVLRPEFLVPHEYDPVDGEQRHVLVTFGGGRPDGIEQAVVDELAGRTVDITGSPLDVLVTRWMRQLHEVVRPSDRPDLTMADLMRTARVVVTSCGRTVHEAAALGVPVMAIPVNEREARHVHCPGVHYLPPWWTLMPGQIAGALERLNDPTTLETSSNWLRRSVDGRGGERVARMVETLTLGL